MAPAAVVRAPTVLGGVPLLATWDVDVCACAGGPCWYQVAVRQLLDGTTNMSALAGPPTSNGANTTFSVSSLPLVDGAILRVGVTCVDSFQRSSAPFFSTGTLVVTNGSRQVDVVGEPLSVSSSRQHINRYQGSHLALQSVFNIQPPVVDRVTVNVTTTRPHTEVSDAAAKMVRARASRCGWWVFFGGGGRRKACGVTGVWRGLTALHAAGERLGGRIQRGPWRLEAQETG